MQGHGGLVDRARRFRGRKGAHISGRCDGSCVCRWYTCSSAAEEKDLVERKAVSGSASWTPAETETESESDRVALGRSGSFQDDNSVASQKSACEVLLLVLRVECPMSTLFQSGSALSGGEGKGLDDWRRETSTESGEERNADSCSCGKELCLSVRRGEGDEGEVEGGALHAADAKGGECLSASNWQLPFETGRFWEGCERQFLARTRRSQ